MHERNQLKKWKTQEAAWQPPLDGFYLPRIPWPYRDVAGFRMSKTWRRQMGSLQRWGCPVPQKPAGSGSSAPGSDGLSFSWQIVGGSPYGGPDIQPCEHPHSLWWGLLCLRHEAVSTEQWIFASQAAVGRWRMFHVTVAFNDILEKPWKKRILPVSSITDKFDCFKVTFKRFPPSWCQHLWGFCL